MKNLYILCGIPGSGKSTWVQKQLEQRPGVWCSRDKVRFGIITDKDAYFSKEDEVFSKWVGEIQAALDNPAGPDDVYADATHVNEVSRNKILNRLNTKNVNLKAVNFIIPLDVCQSRNLERTGRSVVPAAVIEDMYRTFIPATATEKDGRFKEIITVEV